MDATSEWLAAESPPPYTSDSDDTDEVRFDITQYPEFMFIWDSVEDQILLPSSGEGFERMTVEEVFEVERIHSLHWYYVLEPCVGTFHQVDGRKVFSGGELRGPQTSSQMSPLHPTSQPQVPQDVDLSIQPPTEGSESNLEIQEVPRCPLCKDRMEVQFRECTHGTCTSCLIGIWHGRRENRKHLPTWFPCPFCRAKINSIGILSESKQSQLLGFGDDIKHDNTVFTVWGWQPVRRWIALRDESIAQLLKLHNTYGVFSVQFGASGAVVVDQLKFPAFLKAPVGVLPPGTSWTFFVVLFFFALRSASSVPAN